jgi:hypothetical protein
LDADEDLRRALDGHWGVEQLAWFSHGFIALREGNNLVLLADLRMGQESAYVFTFEVARRDPQGGRVVVPAAKLDTPLRARRGLGWI